VGAEREGERQASRWDCGMTPFSTAHFHEPASPLLRNQVKVRGGEDMCCGGAGVGDMYVHQDWYSRRCYCSGRDW
jgi:hypothetical protein